MFYLGLGVKKSLEEAVQWYSLGAERGDTYAAGNLGWVHLHGPISIRDEAKAAGEYALAVALDWRKANLKARKAFVTLDEAAKAKATVLLLRSLSDQEIVVGKDPDDTLILLAREAWLKRNPRTDLF
jgi:TPR repeat protein